jgi:orotidine-5'-phosphate decarboxylase
MEPITALERLVAARARSGSALTVGLDPRLDRLPAELPATIDGLERFCRTVIERTSEQIGMVKINVAFFEALGSAGWAALERIRRDISPDRFLVLDAKRGDIGPSAERSAEALLGHLAADAVTVSPFLGEDAVEPFLAVPGRMVYLLVRTSNPSAGRFQDLVAGGQTLSQSIAAWAVDRWPDGRAGLVVGATDSHTLADLRARFPGPGFLIPGVGAQGGDLASAVAAVDGTAAPGLISMSRALTEDLSDDWADEISRRARTWSDRIVQAGATLGA